MKFKVHYDEHIERVVVIEADSFDNVEQTIDELDHSQSTVIESSYEIWGIQELPEKPKPLVDRIN